MKTIVCHFNLFAAEQSILLVDESSTSKCLGRCPLDQLGSLIALSCAKYQAFNIHLYGNAQYAEGLIQDIDQHTAYSDSKNLIKIEVN